MNNRSSRYLSDALSCRVGEPVLVVAHPRTPGVAVVVHASRLHSEAVAAAAKEEFPPGVEFRRWTLTGLLDDYFFNTDQAAKWFKDVERLEKENDSWRRTSILLLIMMVIEGSILWVLR